jgi:RNA polymerase sigma factor (sigma-70 family)
MTEAHPTPILHHIHHLIGSVPATALTDGELLERFLKDGDDTAVEVLVRRYGPLVFGVCRRVLHNTHTAEDAFQATFFVLIRKAPSLDRARPLGSYLYTVAYRLALRARANELRRQRREEQAARSRPLSDSPASSPSDLLVALEEELHRLPARHRVPLVLCYLDGKTNDQAAEILGTPRGSMAARLERARDRLRECLTRRGFIVSSAALVAALTSAGAQAAVPLPLVDNTVRAALWFSRDDAGAEGFLSTQAVALARGAVRAVFLNRLKITGALLLAVLMLGTGATLLLKAAPQADQPPPEARTRRAEVPGAAPERGANAALQYGQAFIALRRGVGDQDKLLEECLTMPLDTRARQIVTRAAYALRLMQRGAALPRCSWAIDFERGLEFPWTHGEGARVLSSLACLRARIRFEEGRNAEALEDVLAALALARHVSLDGTVDSLRAGYDIEQRLSELLALHLPRLDARTARDLKGRLDALPAGGSASTPALRMTEALLEWIAGEVKEAKDQESLLDFLSQLGVGPREPEKRRAEGRAFLEACGGSARGVLERAEEVRPVIVLLAKKLDLPPEQYEKEWQSQEKKWASNPIFQRFAPVLLGIRVRKLQAEIRRALLSAAVAVQIEGRDALKKHPDPVVGGAFEHVALEGGGFELRSKWTLDEKVRLKWELDKQYALPLTLTVGRRGK